MCSRKRKTRNWESENPINRDEATLSPLTSPSSELPYSTSFCNFDCPIENSISNTPVNLTNPPSLPSAGSFVAMNGNANIESTRRRSPLTRIRERLIGQTQTFYWVAKPFNISSPNYGRRVIAYPIPSCTISRYSSCALATSYCQISYIHSISQNWATSCKCINRSCKSKWTDGKLAIRRTIFASFTGNNCTINYRFFRDNSQVVEEGIDSAVNLIGESQILLDLSDAFLEYKRTNKKLKHVIVQRDPSLFWAIIFRQNFDLTLHDTVVHFAGETGADVGGSLGEFLVLFIGKLPLVGQLVSTNEPRLSIKPWRYSAKTIS